jgi:alpha,alpha-trehalose phosphorylase
VEINHASARYLLEDGGPLDIVHHDKRVKLTAGKAQELPVPAISPRPRPSQPPGREPIRRVSGDQG